MIRYFVCYHTVHINVDSLLLDVHSVVTNKISYHVNLHVNLFASFDSLLNSAKLMILNVL